MLRGGLRELEIISTVGIIRLFSRMFRVCCCTRTKFLSIRVNFIIFWDCRQILIGTAVQTNRTLTIRRCYPADFRFHDTPHLQPWPSDAQTNSSNTETSSTVSQYNISANAKDPPY